MKKSFFVLIVPIILLLGSCKPSINQEQGIGYTEYINTKDLVKFVVDKYPEGQDKAVVYKLDESSNQVPVKEVHFFENGNTQVEGTLKNGKRHGIWTFYHENGKVWSTGEFDMGKSVGIFEIFDKEGQLKFKYHYVNNEIVKEEYYLKGELYKTVDSSDKSNDTSK